jgi:hypothetical protein
MGLEPVSTTSLSANDLGKSAVSNGAESGAVGAQNAPIDPSLALIVNRWPTLPEAARAGILAMVRASG